MFVLLIAVVVFMQTIASLIASHWVYDLSSISKWSWIAKVAGSPARILTVNAGYDETDGQMVEIFPASEILSVDFYPSLARREPSIVRAQKLFPAKTGPVATSISQWPIPDRSIDLLLVAFAAHEVRNHEDRVTLFSEMRRVLSDSGRIVLIEHVQDLANFLAYNIGALHFLKYSDWTRCSEAANLRIDNQSKITPFVRVFELCR
jgi:ubiquinone/menaquinone biosynthesis C-methylase UbiE